MTEVVAMWKMRRLQSRVRLVAERHHDATSLAVCAQNTLPILRDFCDAYDALCRSEIPWMKDGPGGRLAVYNLVLTARLWMPMVVRDVPTIDRANYLDSPVSDDILDDIERLITILRDSRLTDGSTLPYRENAVDELNLALRVAQLKWQEAEATLPEYGGQMRRLRTLANQAHAQLRQFWQAAAFTLSYLNDEYLLLLPSRAGHVADDDERDAPFPEIVEPATLVTGIPLALALQG
jgi:hypothetical protein